METGRSGGNMQENHYSLGMDLFGQRRYDDALEYFQAGIALGDPRCEYALAVMYYNGQGVTKDYALSTAHYTKAADAGILPALVSAGFAYANSLGVPEDFDKAVGYLRQAVAMGDSAAKVTLAEIYSQGYQGGSMREAAAMIKEVLRSGHNEEAMEVYTRYGLGSIKT